MIKLDAIPISTKKVFEILSEVKFISDYSLVGGTALALQIGHRKSEDLDFIFDNETINNAQIKRNINKLFEGNYKIIKDDKDYQIDFVIHNVKVTFFSTGAVIIPFRVKEYTTKYKELNIANIDIIAVLKIATISQRNTIRDYYDLYKIAKNHMPLKDIYSLSKKMLPHLSPITYSETIIYDADIEEGSISAHLEPDENISKQDITLFFQKEIIKIKNSI